MEIRFDPFVAALVSDPNERPDVQVLVGFVGASHRAGYIRVYADLELTSFVEVATADVLYTQPLQDQLGGSALWVRRNARIEQTAPVSRDTQPHFLQGALTAAHLQGTAPTPLLAGGGKGHEGTPTAAALMGITCGVCAGAPGK